jgi:hypothetical protein
MDFWYTWLAYFGLLGGIVVSAILGLPLIRSALVGFVAAAALVTVVNFLDPTPAPCLRDAKGWDVIRAYSLACPK